MKEREVFDQMTQAARRAADAAVAAGNDRQSKIVRESAFAAADQVYRRLLPGDFAPQPAPPVAIPDVAPDDPMKDRLDREPRDDVSRETSDDDIPF